MQEYKDCLACSNSFSEESECENESDKLYCILHEKYVNDNDLCDDFN